MTIEELVYIDSTGYHFADYPSFLQYFKEQYQAIYGADIYLEPDSQDGQIVAIQAKAAYDCAALGGSVYASFSPTTAQGTGLSRVVKINGISRQTPTNSTASVTIVGTGGTVITNGVVTDSNDNKWDLPATVTIPGGGSISVTATCQVEGSILASAGTIDTIFTPTLGWQTVTNPADASPGAPVESDAELRVRQQTSVANPSLTVFDGTLGAVADLDGVTKIQGYENDTASTDGNGIPAHSISVVVVGGDDSEIAETIALHKTPGCGTYGDTSVLVTDPAGIPITIEFERPSVVTIEVTVTVAPQTGWSIDYEDLIKQSLVDYINSLPIGEEILYSKFYNPAYLTGTVAGQSYDIVTLEINKSGDPPGVANILLTWNEDPQSVVADITVNS